MKTFVPDLERSSPSFPCEVSTDGTAYRYAAWTTREGVEFGACYCFTRVRSDSAVAMHSFSAADKKGRGIGCGVRVWAETRTEAPRMRDQYRSNPTTDNAALQNATVYCYTAWATRDGVQFGPCTGSNGEFLTAAERDAAVAKYVKTAQKRAKPGK